MKNLFPLLFLLASLHAAPADNALELFKKGLFAEEADHNLDAAIENYQAAIRDLEPQRRILANCLFHLAEVYRKKGDSPKAEKLYQRVILEFADQPELVAASRQHASQPDSARNTGAPEPFTRAREEIAANQALLEKLKGLPQDQLQSVLPQIIKDDVLEQLTRNLNEAQQKHSALARNYGDQHPLIRENNDVLKTIQQQINDRTKAVLQGLEIKIAALQQSLKAPNQSAETQALTSSSLSVHPSSSDSKYRPATQEEHIELQRVEAMARTSPDLLNSTSQGSSPLVIAAERDYLAVAQFLLDHGASPAIGNPLLTAVQNGHKAIVELLLARGTPVNPDEPRSRTPLHQAAALGFLEITRVLLDHGAKINAVDENGETPLHYAAAHGRTAVIAFLLEKGADINARVQISAGNRISLPAGKWLYGGETPLYIAVLMAPFPASELLLAKGANPNIPNEANGRTPLLEAMPRQPLFELLLEHRAQTEAKDNQGNTALHYANLEAAKSLLARDANVNATNNAGMTPLQTAIFNANGAGKPLLDLITFLLSHGADINARNNHHETALNLALDLQRNNRPRGVAGFPIPVPSASVIQGDVGFSQPQPSSDEFTPAKLVEFLLRHGAKLGINRALIHYTGSSPGLSLSTGPSLTIDWDGNAKQNLRPAIDQFLSKYSLTPSELKSITILRTSVAGSEYKKIEISHDSIQNPDETKTTQLENADQITITGSKFIPATHNPMPLPPPSAPGR